MALRRKRSSLVDVNLVLQVVTAVACVIGCSDSTAPTVPRVQTDAGLVSGKRVTMDGRDVDAFLGIPYAEPPVGDLRFRKPRPKAPWVGTLNASALPAPCWQLPLQFSSKTALNYSSIASEDCLYLNVWRPASACSKPDGCGAKLPVIVFIHGGGFQWGDSALFVYEGSNFVALSDVVFVSFNYRLSILGFLSLDTPELPGNMGLWDQHLVLKWVQKNIRNFGGDPDQVTVSGQSAGGFSVGLHAASPHSRDLFKRVISQSGTPLSMALYTTYRGAAKFIGITTALGCYDDEKVLEEQASSVMACLRKLDAPFIFATLETQGQKEQLFAPIYGDDYLPNHPLSEETWKNLKFREILLGNALDEGSVFFEHLKRSFPTFAAMLSLEYRLPATIVVSQMLDAPLAEARAITDAYFGDPSKQHDTETVRRILCELFADSIFNCPTQLFGDLTAAQGISTYRYIFAHRASHSAWPEWMGVVHGDELPYSLGSLVFLNDRSRYTKAFGTSSVNFLSGLHYTSDEKNFMKQIVRSWSAFIKDGKPVTDKADMEWPKYSAKNPEIVYLRPDNYSTMLDKRRGVCELWRPLLLRKNMRSASTTVRPLRPAASGGPPLPPRVEPKNSDNTVSSDASATPRHLSVILVAWSVLARNV